MQMSAREKAKQANADYREQIIATKRKLRNQNSDLAQRFCKLSAKIEASIERIENERAQGIEPIPQVEFSALDKVSTADKNHIRARGCLIIRNVFDDERVNDWHNDLKHYLLSNDYLNKLKSNQVTDNYFNTLASSKPQIFGIYWSKPQMQARTAMAMAQAQNFLNRLWRFQGEHGTMFDPDRNLLYADRVRFREAGDTTLGLSPHADSGSIERWIDKAYQEKVYRHIYGGDLDRYDAFDAWGRTETEEIPSPAVCSAFRSFQAWTALSPQGKGDGTLKLLPIVDAMAWVLLRALQDDVPEDELCGAAACRAMMLDENYHALLLRAYDSIPLMLPGDMVCWHPDLFHGVEDQHTGVNYSSVMYIAPCPDCEKNRRYAALQRVAFESGFSAPDFAADNFEIDFQGRVHKTDLDAHGLQVMGYEN